MTANEILIGLTARGVRLAVTDDRLTVDAPAGILTDEERAAIRKHKAELLAELKSRQTAIETPAVSTGVFAPPSAEDSAALASGQTTATDGAPDWVTESCEPLAPSDPTFTAAMVDLDEASRYAIEERAAIIEYDGGLPRADAESKALAEWEGRTPEPEPPAAPAEHQAQANPWAALGNLGKKEF